MMAYATVAEIKAVMEITKTDYDDRLETLADRATRIIDRICRRPDGFEADATASARYYCGSGGPIQWIDECVAVTAVAVKDSPSDDEDSYTAWTVGTMGTTTEADCFPASGDPERPDYYMTPYRLLVIGANGDYSTFTSGSYTTKGGFRPSTTIARGVSTVKVTAKWGYAVVVPDDITAFCIAQAAWMFKRGQSGYADATANVETGTLRYLRGLAPDLESGLREGGWIKQAVG